MRRIVALALLSLLVASAPIGHAQPALRSHERWLGEPRGGAPILVALHPWGSSGVAMLRLLERAGFDRSVRVVAPDGPLPYGRGRAWLSSAVADTDPRLLAREASEAADAVAALVRSLRRADEPVIVTGISQGGVVAYALAARSPELARAVVPVAGLLPEPIAAAPSRARVVLVHSEGDPFVPFSRARDGAMRLRAAGATVELRAIRGERHRVEGPLRATYFEALRAEVSALP